MVAKSSWLYLDKASGYFHDGAVWKIVSDGNNIILWMESADLLPEWKWNRNQRPLSKRNTISGKLHLLGVSNIVIDGRLSPTLQMEYDYSEISSFVITTGLGIHLEIRWEQYLPERIETPVRVIDVHARIIQWENIPNLFDDYWKD